jgi:hypothetical protein
VSEYTYFPRLKKATSTLWCDDAHEAFKRCVTGGGRVHYAARMSKNAPTRSGDPSGEWRIEPTSAEGERRKAGGGADPYNRTTQATEPQQVAPKPKARSLDDMRRLSADIQRAPTWVPPRKVTGDELLKEMATLHAKLERALNQIKILSNAIARSGDHRAEELLAQLKEGARHLENALDELTPDPLTLQE